jgi:hypothetical protein
MPISFEMHSVRLWDYHPLTMHRDPLTETKRLQMKRYEIIKSILRHSLTKVQVMERFKKRMRK